MLLGEGDVFLYGLSDERLIDMIQTAAVFIAKRSGIERQGLIMCVFLEIKGFIHLHCSLILQMKVFRNRRRIPMIF